MPRDAAAAAPDSVWERARTQPSEPARPGRPRSGDADRAILDAAVQILGERGFAGLTTSAVIERSGVARATVYRRYPTRDALLLAAATAVKGRPPYALTGDVVDDLRTGARTMARVFGEASFQRFLPAFVAEALEHPEMARTMMRRLAPNFAGISEQYERLAAESGLRTDVHAEVAPTLLIGGLLFRLLSTGRPADQTFAGHLVEVIIEGLEVTPGSATRRARHRPAAAGVQEPPKSKAK